MRESDDRAVQRARLYVDTRAGALKEGGDIVQAIASGSITGEAVLADLFELAAGERSGRAAGDATSITLFKSVGAALEGPGPPPNSRRSYGSMRAPAAFSASIHPRRPRPSRGPARES